MVAIFQGIGQDPVVAAISVLALFGLVLLYLRVQRYRTEYRWVKDAIAAFEATGEDGELTLPLPANAEVVRRIRTISRYAEKGAMPHLGDLNEAIELREEARISTRISLYITSILLVLGLAGTLWAFRRVLGAPQLFDAEGLVDPSKLNDYVRQVYGGLGGAFGASLSGILWTALLLLLKATWVQTAWIRFIDALDSFTEEMLIPRLIQPPLTLPQALRETSLHMESVASKLLELGDTLKSAVSVADASSAELERFSRALLQAGMKLEILFAGESPVERAVRGLESSISEQKTLLSEHWRQTTDERKEFAAGVSRLETLSEVQEDLVKDVGELIADQQAIGHSIKRLAEGIATDSSRITETITSDVKVRKEEQSSLLSNLSANAKRFDSVGKDLKQLTVSLDKASDRHFEMITSLGRSLGADTERQRKAMDAVAAGLDVFTGRLEGILTDQGNGIIQHAPSETAPPESPSGLREAVVTNGDNSQNSDSDPPEMQVQVDGQPAMDGHPETVQEQMFGFPPPLPKSDR